MFSSVLSVMHSSESDQQRVSPDTIDGDNSKIASSRVFGSFRRPPQRDSNLQRRRRVAVVADSASVSVAPPLPSFCTPPAVTSTESSPSHISNPEYAPSVTHEEDNIKADSLKESDVCLSGHDQNALRRHSSNDNSLGPAITQSPSRVQSPSVAAGNLSTHQEEEFLFVSDHVGFPQSIEPDAVTEKFQSSNAMNSRQETGLSGEDNPLIIPVACNKSLAPTSNPSETDDIRNAFTNNSTYLTSPPSSLNNLALHSRDSDLRKQTPKTCDELNPDDPPPSVVQAPQSSNQDVESQSPHAASNEGTTSHVEVAHQKSNSNPVVFTIHSETDAPPPEPYNSSSRPLNSLHCPRSETAAGNNEANQQVSIQNNACDPPADQPTGDGLSAIEPVKLSNSFEGNDAIQNTDLSKQTQPIISITDPQTATVQSEDEKVTILDGTIDDQNSFPQMRTTRPLASIHSSPDRQELQHVFNADMSTPPAQTLADRPPTPLHFNRISTAVKRERIDLRKSFEQGNALVQHGTNAIYLLDEDSHKPTFSEPFQATGPPPVDNPSRKNGNFLTKVSSENTSDDDVQTVSVHPADGNGTAQSLLREGEATTRNENVAKHLSTPSLQPVSTSDSSGPLVVTDNMEIKYDIRDCGEVESVPMTHGSTRGDRSPVARAPSFHFENKNSEFSLPPVIDIDDYDEDHERFSPICISDDEEEDGEEDSDIEFVGEVAARDVVSNYVKLSLERLHLENVIVVIPKFTRCSPPTADDKEVLRAIGDFLELERTRRQKTALQFSSVCGSVLVIAGSLRRAKRIFAVFEGHSDLRVGLHQPVRSKRRRRYAALSERPPLDDIMGNVDVVISTDKAVLSDCVKNCANLRNVLLLVLDSVENTWRRAHPVSMIMRDHYRSLGEQQRPRVLAISRREVLEGQMAPIEFNLFAKFKSESVENARWKSCLGKGSRLVEHELLDVEYLYYRRDGHDMRIEHGRKLSSTARVRDRRAFSAIDSVVDEVGPLGVQLYRKCVADKKIRLSKLWKWGKKRRVQKSIGEESAALGVTQKMMSLLNEIYEAYRASTEIDSLMGIVHAGAPTVAFAVSEVIKSMPIFESLDVSVVLGKGAETEVGSSDALERLDYRDLQGHDTDDDVVSAFVAGDTNLLIVSNQFTCENKNKRPLPSCPLVLRFDGSDPNPKIDGAGGRCRVVVFKETRISQNEGNGNTSRQEQSELVCSDNGPSSKRRRKEASGLDTTQKKNISKNDDPETCHFAPSSAVPEEKDKPQQLVIEANSKQDNPVDYNKERRNYGFPAELFHFRPPRSLLGPALQARERVYIYRILLYNTDNISSLPPLRELIRSGLEDFIIVLSEKLDDNDMIVSLKDVANGTGNGTVMDGQIRLDYQGSITFTAERLKMAREYNMLLFSLIDSSLTPNKFNWDVVAEESKCKGNDPSHPSFLRRYVLLPVVSCGSEPEESGREVATPTREPDVNEELKREMKISTYFETKRHFASDIPSHVKVDWKLVETILGLQDRENHNKEYQLCNSYAPPEHHYLQGKLLFSSLPNETLLLSGHLQYETSPLTLVTRGRKFPLNDDGTFKPHEDLSYLLGTIKANNYTIEKQAKATGVSESIDVIDLDDDSPTKKQKPSDILDLEATEDSKDLSKTIPVVWCEKQNKLIPSRNQNPKHNECQLFNCQRNVMKKRVMWSGTVCYKIEQYYNRFYKHKIQHLDQPLLQTCRPQKATINDLRDILQGNSVADVCGRIAKNGVNSRLVVPELSRVYPISIGSIFLPVTLFYIERHLLICELRNMFVPKLVGKPDFSLMIRAVTASFVNNTMNYERLEFLGDSLLKLSSTTRLIVKHTHVTEGALSSIRSRVVSNASLYRIAKKLGLYNYLIFETVTAEEWNPPGTDIRGKGNRIQMKGLADVIEALCGVYLLLGVSQSKHPNSSKRVKIDEDQDPSCSNEHTSDEALVDSDADDADIDEQNIEADESRSAIRKRKRSLRASNNNRFQFTKHSIALGYQIGCNFLEFCGVLQGTEPTHKEMLLAGIHALHPSDSIPPTEVTLRAFPLDSRLSNPETPWEQELGVLEGIIRYKFKRRHLLVCALTHSSYVKPDGKSIPSTETFERLEFLGDAVTDFYVVCYLYERYPELGPGELTNLKGNVVSNESYARISVTRGFHKYLYHSSAQVAGEIDNFVCSMSQDLTMGGSGAHSGFKRDLGEIAAPKVLGDIFEAIIGAIYIDSGLTCAWKVCAHLLEDTLRINGDPEREDLHPCDELADMVIRVWKLSSEGPYYRTERGSTRSGTACTVFVMGRKISTGRGTTAKRAKLTAATAALKLLSDESGDSHGAILLKELKEESLRRKVARRKGK